MFLNNLKRDHIEVSPDYLVMKLTEELGEFVHSFLIHTKKCRPVKYLPPKKFKKEISKELADVLGIVLVIAKTMKVDFFYTLKQIFTRK